MAAVNGLWEFHLGLERPEYRWRGLESPIRTAKPPCSTQRGELAIYGPGVSTPAIYGREPLPAYAVRSARVGWMSSRTLGDIVEQRTMLLMYWPFAPVGFAR